MRLALADAKVVISQDEVSKSALLSRVEAEGAHGAGDTLQLRHLHRRQLVAWLHGPADDRDLQQVLECIEVRRQRGLAASGIAASPRPSVSAGHVATP